MRIFIDTFIGNQYYTVQNTQAKPVCFFALLKGRLIVEHTKKVMGTIQCADMIYILNILI